ncbi:beta-ketoacyl synthase chain length factor [Photobacterium nomapromontoriensis]|uniref:beta-ketoacyl synthase chain length factor n=1 Tax=Photobacterium nomapromontoriensis TaxID=2910237 RepID=UPI003D0F337A
MSTIKFNILNWSAISPGLTEPESWSQWLADGKCWPEALTAVPSDSIPAMMRRRMSTLSKLAVQTAITLSTDQQVDYVIFSSRHGEFSRTCQLLDHVIAGQPASPMAFSQSVHNTAVGLFTIATKQAIPSTSVSACLHSVHAGLIEAVAYLSEYPHHRVLVVDFDEPLPDNYSIYERSPYHGYALGLVLSAGDQYQLDWQSQRIITQHDQPVGESDYPQGLAIIAGLLSETDAWSVSDTRFDWRWQRRIATG